MGTLRRPGGLFLAFVAVVVGVGPARADDKALLERLERLEKQNEDLKKRLDMLPGSTSDVKKTVDSYLGEKDDKKKKADDARAREKAEAGFEVGKQLDMKAKWLNGPWLESEDRAFRFHIGGRAQCDGVWVHAPQPMMGPLSQAGIGEFDDAVDFRRARIALGGTFWEVFDFDCEYDFVNAARSVPSGNVLGNQQSLTSLSGTVADRQNIANTPAPTELWVQWSKIPYLGNIRVGNQKGFIGFEHLTSSRFLDFMERSSAFDAFIENGNNGFQPGVGVFNHYFDERMFVGVGAYKTNFRDIFGSDVGDGEYQVIGRVAGTPVYAAEGRCLLHLGLGVSHAGADDGVVRFRARTQLRNGSPVIHNTVAIIQAQAHNLDLIVPEIALVYGPFNLSGEYYYAQARMKPGQGFQNVNNQTGAVLPSGGRGTLVYQGAYLTLGYFLTGESRSYDRRRMSWDRQAVNEPAFAVETDRGIGFGRGAVEVLARYSWLDLASQGVNGGVLNTGTFGVNWYLNPNAKFQVNYEIGYRDATEYGSRTVGGVTRGGFVTAVGQGIRDGIYQGVGTRLAFDF